MASAQQSGPENPRATIEFILGVIESETYEPGWDQREDVLLLVNVVTRMLDWVHEDDYPAIWDMLKFRL